MNAEVSARILMFSSITVCPNRVYPSLITLPVNEFPCSEVQSQVNSHHSIGIVKLQERFSTPRLKLTYNPSDSVQLSAIHLGFSMCERMRPGGLFDTTSNCSGSKSWFCLRRTQSLNYSICYLANLQ